MSESSNQVKDTCRSGDVCLGLSFVIGVVTIAVAIALVIVGTSNNDDSLKDSAIVLAVIAVTALAVAVFGHLLSNCIEHVETSDAAHNDP